MALVKYNNNSISAVTAAASIPSDALVPIKTLTASSSANLSFVHGTDGVVLDSTYPIYIFKFINCHPSGNVDYLSVNFSIAGFLKSTLPVFLTSGFPDTATTSPSLNLDSIY